MQSESVENFLKAVYSLQQKTERVSTNSLAEALKISAPSVTDMARRMEKDGLVDYQKYRGVRLTDDGKTIALHVIRRHRLLEAYLVEELGYALHEVHDEAENLEHSVSDRFVDAISSRLGNPTVDPHGDPIPAADGTVNRPETIPLSQLGIGIPAKVSRLTAGNPDMLQHILDRDFNLGAAVQILHKDPFDGPLTTLVNNQERIIGYNVAACILMEVE